ncbi:MAG: STAS domain-containing protein [Micrococcales bacterium]|nr:STAS domain-containing protein [Micrococcales bacterium]MCL2666244.1 STAS domain-containing protein [Micrococcales bacterium]
MSFEEVDQSAYVVLTPEGKFNLVAAPPFKARVDDLVAAGKVRLVVDLHAVDFIDSSGLGVLIGGLKSARQHDGDLRIAASGSQVQAVLKLTNLDRILTPYATIEEACHDW